MTIYLNFINSQLGMRHARQWVMDFNSKWLAILKGAEPVALKMWDYFPTYEKTFLSFSREGLAYNAIVGQ